MSEIWIGVRDLKSRLSAFLRQVKEGHTVIITAHGHPVARLIPIEQPLDERLKALKDAGMIAWNGQKLKPITPLAINRSQKQVSDLLVEMRE